MYLRTAVKKIVALILAVMMCVPSVMAGRHNILTISDETDLSDWIFYTGGDGNTIEVDSKVYWEGQNSVKLFSATGSSVLIAKTFDMQPYAPYESAVSAQTFVYVGEIAEGMSAEVYVELIAVNKSGTKKSVSKASLDKRYLKYYGSGALRDTVSLPLPFSGGTWVKLETPDAPLPSDTDRLQVELKLNMPLVSCSVNFDSLKLMCTTTAARSGTESVRTATSPMAWRETEYALQNFGFEESFCDRTNYSWNVVPSGRPANYMLSDEDVYSGKRAIKIDAPIRSRFGIWQVATMDGRKVEDRLFDQNERLEAIAKQSGALRPQVGDRVQASAMLKLSGNQPMRTEDNAPFVGRLSVYSMNARGERMELAYKEITGLEPGKWIEITTNFADYDGFILPDVDRLIIYLLINNISSENTIFVDDIRFKRIENKSVDALENYVSNKFPDELFKFDAIPELVLDAEDLIDAHKAKAGLAVDVTAHPYNADNTARLLSTENIQRAIDDMAAKGGEVYFPPGEYRTVTLRMRSNVTLNIAKGAVIQASKTQDNWYDTLMPLLLVDGVENITITGKGILDGGSETYRMEVRYEGDGHVSGNRPKFLLLAQDSRNILVRNVTFRNSVSWTMNFSNCENLTVRGVKVRNPIHSVHGTNDGIDLNGCRNVLIEHCDIETGDDGIVIKNIAVDVGLAERLVTRNPSFDILVRNCVVASTTNSTKIGTETYGDIRNITFENITVKNHSSADARKRPCIAAIAVQSIDHSNVENITFRNYKIEDCDTPIFVGLQIRRARIPFGGPGSIRNILLQNIEVMRSSRASQINTEISGYISDITLDNVKANNFEYAPQPIPLTAARPTGEKYPEASAYGRMPAFGLFARDVSGLVITGDTTFIDKSGSGRPMYFFENVN